MWNKRIATYCKFTEASSKTYIYTFNPANIYLGEDANDKERRREIPHDARTF